MTLSWGIAATGRIAREVGGVIAAHPRMRVAAVGSRDLGRAQALAADLGGRAHGSYAAMVADPDVDAVYVATPHSGHAEVVELALAAGKAVLCEKPLTHDLGESERLAALARDSGVFCMEALWMRFNPLVRLLADTAAAGGLGELRTLTAAFGFVAAYDEASRLWDPALGGGALLDLGIYPVDLARLLLGDPTSVTARGALAPTGVDSEASLLLTFRGGARALLDCSLVSAQPRVATLVGTRGWAALGPSFHAPTSLVLEVDGERVGHTQPDRFAGFLGEVEEVERCLAAGRTESEVLPLAETLATMRVLDTAMRQVGEHAGRG